MIFILMLTKNIISMNLETCYYNGKGYRPMQVVIPKPKLCLRKVNYHILLHMTCNVIMKVPRY